MSSRLSLDCLSRAHRYVDQPARHLRARAAVDASPTSSATLAAFLPPALGTESVGSYRWAVAERSPRDTGRASASPARFHIPAAMTQPRGRAWADYTPTTPGAALEIFGFFGTNAEGVHGCGTASAGTASFAIARTRLETIECDSSGDESQDGEVTVTKTDSYRSAAQTSKSEGDSDITGSSPTSPTVTSFLSMDSAEAEDIGDLPSEGSALHDGNGGCRPCAWFWKSGCINGKLCRHCHLCPEGELKRRKEEKRLRLAAITGVMAPRKKGKKQRKCTSHAPDAPMAAQASAAAGDA